MKKEYFIVQARRNHEEAVVVWLSLANGGFYWSREREGAMQFSSERSAYLSALRHIGVVSYVLHETIRVVRLSERIDEEVLET